MMLQQISKARAGKLLPVVTRPGAPAVQRWAEVTTALIMAPGAAADLETRAQVRSLGRQVQGVLESAFSDVTLLSSAADLTIRAEAAVVVIVAAAGRTRWAVSFANPIIRRAMVDLVGRCLVSARDALRG